MARIKLCKGQQKRFLNRVAKHFDNNWSRVAKISDICERSLRDWRREKYNMNYETLLKLQKISNISIPMDGKVLSEYWSARKFARRGGLKRYQMYGKLGTPEGRRQGGINSQKLFRLNPEYAKSIGIITRKDIRKPKPSVKLAEFIGIMLGDGGMNDYQINVTFNTKTDNEYGVYVRSLIKQLFAISAPIIATDSVNADRIVVSGRNLVEFLEKKGLKKGNKVRNQVDIPKWILANRSYRIACLRGLIDTDGSFYLYKHKVSNKIYCNFAMCFTNHSKPLLKSVCKILKDFHFFSVNDTKRAYLHKKEDIQRYFTEIGTHNLKHLQKYKNWVAVKSF